MTARPPDHQAAHGARAARLAAPSASQRKTARASCALALAAACVSSTAVARTGTGDPVEVFRDRPVNPDHAFDLVIHGHLRLRTQLGAGLDLGRGPSPTNGEPLFEAPGALVDTNGDGVLDAPLLGHDARVRFSPSLFVGDDVRLFLDVDVLAAALGPAATGVPWSARSDAARSLALAALDVRAVGVDWLLPVGVLSVGRMPAHFGLGVGANAGDTLDDDGGDRADRVAFTAPFYGHLVAAALDIGPRGAAAPQSDFGPTTRALSIGEQAVAIGVMHWRAPWELALHRAAERPALDWGAAVALEWTARDAPPPWVSFDPTRDPLVPQAVRRDAHLAVGDLWLRAVWGRFRLEGEAFAADLAIDNPSPWQGVVVRRTLRGNPAAFALVGEAQLLALPPATLEDASPPTLALQLEIGAASADPAPGFPDLAPTAFNGSTAGDVFGPQVDLKRGGDARIDAARLHPLHRIDLILWRTLLGGVSEAAYARAHLDGRPIAGAQWLRLESTLVYSHALSSASAPGGVAPLGVELDVGAEATLGGSSLRVDAGTLAPLGGLGARGGPAPALAHLVLVRLGHVL